MMPMIPVQFSLSGTLKKIFVLVKKNYSNSIICGNFVTSRTYILLKRIYNK